MADRTTYPICGLKTDLQLVTAKLVGGGAADMTNGESSNMGAGEVVTAARTGAGKFTLTFRNRYPQLKSCWFGVVGTTDGLIAQFASIDVNAKTAALEIYVGSTPTDPATTDTVFVNLLVRNSNFNT
jgi:hypothetical protein